MTAAPDAAYDLILDRAGGAGTITRLGLGTVWTCCRSNHGLGFAMTLGDTGRTRPWPGTVVGRPLAEVAAWLRSWDPVEAAVGLAAANAAINRPGNPVLEAARPLAPADGANLSVFRHFRDRLEGKRVVVIGRYPGLDAVLDGLDAVVLERSPGPGDLPDPAAEFVLPEADWVFLTASSLANKTFPRLAALARNAVTVLMGPSTPWLAEWADFGIDFLAGVRVTDADLAESVAMEGGGTRLFESGVSYAVADIGAARLDALKADIAQLAAERTTLTGDMDRWYAVGSSARFPGLAALEEVSERLSKLDTAYKRQWDARRGS